MKDIMNEDEIKQKLTPEEYKVLREKGTEAPGTGKYLHEKRAGTYICKVCGNKLFSSDAKFDSGTGWPSFDDALPGAVKHEIDTSHGMNRTEVVCAKCGSHLGHVFDDLPASWPDRYYVYVILCENGDLYIGQTNNMQERWSKHCNGSGAEHTAKYKPKSIIHYEIYNSREKAVEREKWLKTGFGRKWIKREWKAGRLPVSSARQTGTRQAGGPQETTGKRYCMNSVCLDLKEHNDK